MKLITTKTLVAAAALLVTVLTMPVWADEAPSQQQAETAIREALDPMPVESVKPAPIEGLYEVIVGGSLVYFTADAKYLIQGDIIDQAAEINLTEQAESSMRAAVFAEQKEFVRFPAEGESKYVLNVFTDIDCGYCRRLHDEVPELNEKGVEVRYFFYPRAGVMSDSARKAESVWCGDDQQELMDEAKAGNHIPRKRCDNPIKEHVALAHEMGLRGTPLIFTGKGTKINGYRPVDKLMAILIGDDQ
ncbi:thiol-disulfide interchange protein DsbC [gamma proteobacterium HTCC5015]|nr:thiol-disulfide interchange protein DsbC [gamma proteobacterium HTCC5015]